jgi:hypothetical protein
MLFISINGTGDKREKFSGIIFFIFCEELSLVYISPKDEIFAYFSFSGVGKLIRQDCLIAGVVDTAGKFIGGVVDNG